MLNGEKILNGEEKRHSFDCKVVGVLNRANLKLFQIWIWM